MANASHTFIDLANALKRRKVCLPALQARFELPVMS